MLPSPLPQGVTGFNAEGHDLSFSAFKQSCFTAATGRRYRIQSSTNLLSWNSEQSFPTPFSEGFNGNFLPVSVVFAPTGVDQFTIERLGSRKFLRASVFHAANELCNNNLKTIRFASELYAYEHGYSLYSTVTFENLRPYFKNGILPVCPSFGTYAITTVLRNPTCSVHPFEEP